MHMAEEQSAHRRQLEHMVITSNIREAYIGQFLGFLIGVIALAFGTLCIYSGHAISGSLIGTSGVIGLVSVFVYGRQQARRERAQKESQ